jgi:hypothetical protein
MIKAPSHQSSISSCALDSTQPEGVSDGPSTFLRSFAQVCVVIIVSLPIRLCRES